MTEAKSPREIAERLKQLYDECMKRTPNAMHVFAEYRQMYPLIKAEIDRLATLCGLHWRTIQDANDRAEKAESYTAERERLLADADWLIDNIVTQLREMYIASPIGPVTDAAMERHRLRSRPATEGKREDD